MAAPEPSGLLASLAVAAAAGLIGVFAVMRRMTLASDAFSHVALPGVAVALLWRVNPVVGGLAALLAGAVVVWLAENRTTVPTEAIIGVLFSAALAAGSMLASGEELIEALFGGNRVADRGEAALAGVGAAFVIGFLGFARDRLVLTQVSPDLARTAGIDVRRIELLYLLAFAVTVALGLRVLGVLMMGSLVIVPAATAKHLARSLLQMCAIAVAASVSAMLAGDLLAPSLGVERGPLTVLVAAAIFAASLAVRRGG